MTLTCPVQDSWRCSNCASVCALFLARLVTSSQSFLFRLDQALSVLLVFSSHPGPLLLQAWLRLDFESPLCWRIFVSFENNKRYGQAKTLTIHSNTRENNTVGPGNNIFGKPTNEFYVAFILIITSVCNKAWKRVGWTKRQSIRPKLKWGTPASIRTHRASRPRRDLSNLGLWHQCRWHSLRTESHL